MPIDFKNEKIWGEACGLAVNYARIHASLRAKPWSAAKLFASISTKLSEFHGQSGSNCCHGHVYQLRQVYGGVYNGIALSRRAIARNAEIAAKQVTHE